MRPLGIALTGVVLVSLYGCGGGRVRVGQGTEIKQEEVYEPQNKAEPPEGNIDRRPEAYPLLEVDLERKREPYQPSENEPPAPEE